MKKVSSIETDVALLKSSVNKLIPVVKLSAKYKDPILTEEHLSKLEANSGFARIEKSLRAMREDQVLVRHSIEIGKKEEEPEAGISKTGSDSSDARSPRSM